MADQPTTPTKKPTAVEPQTERGKIFAKWAEERSKMTEDEIFAIEAESQGLRKIKKDKGFKKAPTDKAQLKAEYEADLRVLKQEGPEALQQLEKELQRDEAQLKAEYEMDLRVLEQEGPEALQQLEEELRKGRMTFADWVEERSKMTEDEIFAIEAYTQKLPGAVKPTPKPKPKPTVPKELLIERTPYPKWWNDSLNARIEFTGPGSRILARVSGKLKLFVATIVITVTGETEIRINFGAAGASGPIYLGGENQPMGIVIAMGNSPAPCEKGPLSISATGDPQKPISIGGFATCFVMPEKIP